MGRPRKQLPPGGLDIIRQGAANGLSEVRIAHALGMSWDAWKRIRDENDEAREAWEEARAAERDELVGLLMLQARGTPAEFDGEGNMIRAEQPRVPAAAMFLLKARHGYREHGDAPGAVATAALQLVMPAPMTMDQFRAMGGPVVDHSPRAAS